MTLVDILIVGHGLAGATLAWQLRWLGKSVAVVDRESPDTASRVSAGLITPITGRRNVASYRFDDFWKAAQAFYGRVEEETQSKLLVFDRTLRVANEEQLRQLENSEESRQYVAERTTLQSPFHPRSAVQLSNASRLDVSMYLDYSRTQLRKTGHYFAADIDLSRDLRTDGELIEIPSLSLTARRVIFCQGVAARENPWFSDWTLQPAKGEILEVALETGLNRTTILGDVWIVPSGKGRCFVGATFEREFVHSNPTPEGRDELMRRLAAMTDCHPTVVQHRAAVRPVLAGRQTKVGMSVHDRRFGCFNGLGSKGALRAPLVAEQFSKFLVDQQPIDPDFVSNLPNASPRKLTELAQGYVSDVVHSGDVAIDATAGNGRDTVFLSQAVGDKGLVFAIDRQAEALSRTAARLKKANLSNVVMKLGSHDEFDRLIPDSHHGEIAAVMFNLGYLPRGDESIVTKAESTVTAIRQCRKLLRRGGIVTIIAYTGHDGGLSEAIAVEELLRSSYFERFQIALPEIPLQAGPPRLYIVKRE